MSTASLMSPLASGRTGLAHRGAMESLTRSRARRVDYHRQRGVAMPDVEAAYTDDPVHAARAWI